MTITVPLTPEEEAKLAAIAKGRGVSPDAFIKSVVKEILERTNFAPNGQLSPDEKEKRLEELFAAFDSLSIEESIREEAFHRENWYR